MSTVNEPCTPNHHTRIAESEQASPQDAADPTAMPSGSALASEGTAAGAGGGSPTPPRKRYGWASLSVKLNLLTVPLILMGLAVMLITRTSLQHNAGQLIRALEVKELTVRLLALLLTQDDASKAMMLDPENTTAGARKIGAYDDSREVLQRMEQLCRSAQMHQILDELSRIDEVQLRPLDTELLETVAAGDLAATKEMYFNKYEPVRATYEATLRRLVEASDKAAAQAASDVEVQNNKSLRDICAALGAGTLLVVGVMWFCARRFVSQPVRRMAADMLRIAESRRYDRDLAEASRRDELGDSAEAFNSVLGVVRASVRALQDANKNLEARVRERTSELAQSNAQMGAIQRAAMDCIICMDRRGLVTEFNPAAEATFGYKRDEAVGRLLPELIIPPDQRERHRQGMERYLRTGAASLTGRRTEVNALRADGSEFPVELAVTVVNPNGEPSFTAYVRDLTERKRSEAEREELHKRLVDASRHAGMAEVATGVLHNVGNVLNSVNVSANLAVQKLRQSEVPTLKKAAVMIRQHREDLGSYLTSDARGRLLPDFLVELSQCLSEEQSTLLEELQSIGSGLEHIKEIVRAQQAHAKGVALRERVSPADLMDTAVKMHLGSLANHDVQLNRRYADITPVVLDKHKALQILVNLISNAKNALKESGRADKAITLVVETRNEEGGGGPRVCCGVIDNGIGIDPANLTKIFSHGFTTRKEGHGFGLHSAANLAKEMGGRLLAASGGPGQGAAFTLELPSTPLADAELAVA